MPDYERRGDELRWRGIGYQKGAGYVGLGEVVAKAVPVKDFKIGETGTILDAELDQPGLKKNSDDERSASGWQRYAGFRLSPYPMRTRCRGSSRTRTSCVDSATLRR